MCEMLENKITFDFSIVTTFLFALKSEILTAALDGFRAGFDNGWVGANVHGSVAHQIIQLS